MNAAGFGIRQLILEGAAQALGRTGARRLNLDYLGAVISESLARHGRGIIRHIVERRNFDDLDALEGARRQFSISH